MRFSAGQVMPLPEERKRKFGIKLPRHMDERTEPGEAASRAQIAEMGA